MALPGNWIPTGNDQQRLTMQLRALVNSVQQAQQLAAQVSGTMAQMTGGGGSATTVETYYSVQAGSGQAVANIVGTVNASLQNAADGFLALVQQCG